MSPKTASLCKTCLIGDLVEGIHAWWLAVCAWALSTLYAEDLSGMEVVRRWAHNSMKHYVSLILPLGGWLERQELLGPKFLLVSIREEHLWSPTLGKIPFEGTFTVTYIISQITQVPKKSKDLIRNHQIYDIWNVIFLVINWLLGHSRIWNGWKELSAPSA